MKVRFRHNGGEEVGEIITEIHENDPVRNSLTVAVGRIKEGFGYKHLLQVPAACVIERIPEDGEVGCGARSRG